MANTGNPFRDDTAWSDDTDWGDRANTDEQDGDDETPTGSDHETLQAAIERYTRGLNPEQAEAVRALTGPVIVVAGPGSGKTRVLTHRIALLVASDTAEPWRILAVTFTNKAAEEMRERVTALLPDVDPKRLWVSTFHSFCAKFLRIECEAAGLPSAYTILDTSDVRTILREIHAALEIPSEPGDIRNSASTISRVKNGMPVRPDNTMSKIMDAYQSRLARLGALDFDDLLGRTRDLLAGNAEVRERWQKRFSSILVDEYQDTNPVQYAIVGILAARHRNICVVGDADQAIYGFRAATPEALVNFQNDWGAETRVVKLGENYRSTPEILEVCQSIIDGNPSDLRPELRTTNAPGEPVRMIVHPDDRGEARFVAEEIRTDLPRGSVAVLMRTNAQTRSFEEALLAQATPYTVVGALRFYERAEIKDAVSYLRLVTNPTDVLALTRCVAAPRRGIGPKALLALETAADGRDLVATLRNLLADGGITRSRSAWEEFLGLLERIDEAVETQGPVAAIRCILDGGLREYVRAHGGENAVDRVENLDELLSGAAEFASTVGENDIDETGEVLTPRRLTELYLERIALTSSSEEAEGGGPGAVALLTAHASKGKEFDTVHVVGVEENLFPHGRRGEIADENEERRLLFVACSRARTRLTLHRAKQRFLHGQIVTNPESRFTSDLPANVEHVDRARVWPGSLHSGPRSPRPGSRAENWGRPGGRRGGNSSSSAPWHASESTRNAVPIANNGPRMTAEETTAGVRVRHDRFGEGTVTGLSGQSGDEIVHIRFGDGQERQFKLSLAPLTKLG
jgi:DNA helicase-2/ATP-dependent DNA helicase PcrA